MGYRGPASSDAGLLLASAPAYAVCTLTLWAARLHETSSLAGERSSMQQRARYGRRLCITMKSFTGGLLGLPGV